MKFSEFQQLVESPQPVYALLTKETYFKQQVYEFCKDQVDASARSFDWSVFDLEKDSIIDVVNTARTLPWMAPRRWVYVRDLANAGRGLIDYANSPASRTVLILETSRLPAKWPKVPLIEFEKNPDPVRWVVAQVRKEGYRIEPQAARALVELAGEDLQRLSRELEKQQLSHWESKEITLEAVRTMTLQSREYDVFALIGAMAAGQSSNVLQILNRLCDMGVGAPQILALLYWNFRRLRVAKEMLDQGRPFQIILKDLKIWSYRGKERAVRGYSLEWLETTLLGIRRTDRLCKTTSGEIRFHLERLLIDSCQKSLL